MKYKTRRYYIYYCLKAFLFLASKLPLQMTLFLGDLGGRAAFRALGRYSKTAVGNLDLALGGAHADNVRIARDVFRNMAKNGAEWLKLYSMPPGKLGDIVTEAEGLEKLDKVLAGGNGALVLGFHFGNWELLGMYLRHRGYEGSLVARRIYFHKYNKLLERLRKRFDAPTIYRDESPRKMLKELRAGRILGIVPDQDVDSIEGTFVDFFGRPAFTPVAPVKMAMAGRTSIVPVFLVRKDDDTHKLVVEDPIDVGGTDATEEDVKKFTQEWTSLLEKYVRRHPEQWVWVHERWKTGKREP